MSGRKSYKCNYHKKHRDFRLISEIRQWIIDFWYNFIKRLKNVLSERRLSRIQSQHTKSITNISTHVNTHIDAEKSVKEMKSPVKLKKSRKHKRKIEKTDEIFEELSDDYLALYRKKSCSHLTPKKTNSMMIDRKRSSCSTRSRRGSKHSQISLMVQQVTQQYIGDGFIDDLNWIPKFFGCIVPSNSSSRINLPKIDNNQADNHEIDDTNKLEKIKIRNQKHSKIPRYQYQHSAVINKPKPKIPYSKHHKNCINNN